MIFEVEPGTVHLGHAVAKGATAGEEIELGGLKLAALKRRAKRLGATASQLEDIDESDDPKATAIELVLAQREALGSMKLAGLKKLLRKHGADDDDLEPIDESDDPKTTAIEMILQAAQAASGGGGASPAPSSPAAAAPERPFDWPAFWPEQAEVDAAAAIAIPGAASFDSDEMLGSSIGSSLPGTLGSLLLDMSPGFPDTMHGGSGSGSGSGSGESGGGLPRAPSGSPRVSPPDGAPADPGFGGAFALPSFDDGEREAAVDS